MNPWTRERIAKQTIFHAKPQGPWQKVEVTTRGVSPSWKRFGDGANHISVEAAIAAEGVPCIRITASETAYGDNGRNTTKGVYVSLHGDAALEVYELLRRVFEPKVGGPAA